MLSRMHYQAIVGAVRNAADRRWGADAMPSDYATDGAGIEALAEVVGDLCDYFAKDNPGFDRGRFLTACNISESNVAEARRHVAVMDA